MNTALTVIALLGLGALIVSVYIFAVTARQFVSEESSAMAPAPRPLVPRRGNDRRQSPDSLTFPATVNGVLIYEDRRQLPDRRRSIGQFA